MRSATLVHGAVLLAALITSVAACGGANAQRANEQFAQGKSAETRRDYKTAITDFNAAVAAGNDDARLYYDRALAHYNLKQYTDADADFTQAIDRAAHGDTRLATKFTRAAHYYRGLSRIWITKYAGAKDDLLLAAGWYPSDWLGWDSLGYARAQLGDYAHAVPDYDRGLRLHPNDAIDRVNRGYALYRTGLYRRAVDDFTIAMHLSPRMGTAYQYRGLSYAASGDYRDADADYTTAIKLIPKAWSWTYRCEARESLNRIADALYDCNKAIAYYPTWATPYLDRAWAKAMRGDNKGGLADANAAVKYDPKWAVAYKYRAWIRVRLAQYRAAFVDYDKALQIAPHYEAASVGRTALANWIVTAQNAGVTSYGIGSIDVQRMENYQEPTQSEYQQRVGACGGYYSESDSYFQDCVDNGVDQAKNDESADREAADQEASAGYDAEHQIQDQINQAQTDAENAAAAASSGYDTSSGGSGYSSGDTGSSDYQSADSGGSADSGSTEPQPVEEQPAPEPVQQSDSGGG